MSPEPERLFYFAYDVDRSSEWLERHGISVHQSSPAWVHHHRLEFNALEDPEFYLERRGRANLVVALRESTEGMLHEVDAGALARLDELNGVETLQRYRKQIPVHCDEGDAQIAVVYVAWPEHTSSGLKPTAEYHAALLNTVQTGNGSPGLKQWLHHHPTIV